MTINLPETVVAVLGPEASRDLADWLAARGLDPHAPAQVQISAFVARQKVNVLMLEQVSNLLLAGDPALEQTAGGRWQWRVPITLTFPAHGPVAQVGELTVDAQHGNIDYDDAHLARITAEAERQANQVLAAAP